jgi:WD40 repeat protein
MALTDHLGEKLQQLDAERRAYILALLPVHLAEAQLYDQLHSLLTDFQFMNAKVSHLGVHPLIDDYALYPNDIPELALLKQALQLSAHNVIRDRTQLASQLVGRLLSSKNEQISRILTELKETKRGPWLRPLTSSLTKPGGALLSTLIGHQGPICAIVVTPDSQHIISAAEDSTLRIWDSASGKLVRTVTSRDNLILYHLKFLKVTSGGDQLITISSQHQFAVWDLRKGTVVSSRRAAGELSVTPDGRRLISMDVVFDRGKSEPAHFIDMATGAEWDVGDFTDRNALALSADGSRVIVVTGNTLEMWDVQRRVLSRIFKGHKLSVTSLAVTPDWRYAVSCGWDSNLIVWDVERGTKIHSMTVERGYSGWLLVVTPDGRRAISASQGVPLKIWDLERGAELYSSGKESSLFTVVALSPDHRQAALGSDNTISILDLNAGFESSVLGNHSSPVTAIAIAPNGRYAVSGSHDMTLKVWDLASGNQGSDTAQKPTKASSICVSRNGSRAMVLREDSRPEVWNLNEGREEAVPLSLDIPKQAVLTADGQQIVFASNDGALHVFDIDGGVVQHIMRGHEDQVIALTAAPEPGRVVSGSRDGTIRVWDTRRGLELSAVHAIGGQPSSIRLLSCGRYGLFFSNDEVSKWDLQRNVLVDTRRIHPGLATAFLTPDLRYAIGWKSVEGEQPIAIHEGAPVMGKDTVVWKSELGSGDAVQSRRTPNVPDAFSISPDGNRVAWSSSFVLYTKVSNLFFWDVGADWFKEIPNAHSEEVTCVNVSETFPFVVSGSKDRSLKVWEMSSERAIASFDADSAFTMCDVSPEAGIIVATDTNRQVHFLRLEGVDLTRCPS